MSDVQRAIDKQAPPCDFCGNDERPRILRFGGVCLCIDAKACKEVKERADGDTNE